MEQESSSFICIFNWKKDKFLLLYPDKFESWEICHIGVDEVIMNCRFAYICMYVHHLAIFSADT